jgi:hypothetical protein
MKEIHMKRILIGGLLLMTLAGSAPAQQPVPQVYQQVPVGGPSQPAWPATTNVPFHSYPTVVHGDCTAGCCAPTKTICVPEQSCKEVKTPVYSKGCEPFCVPNCGCHWRSLFGGCDSGCEQPRTKYFLVKKYCVEQIPVTKCVPVTVPACGAAPGCGAATVESTTPTAVVPTATLPYQPYRPMPK